MFEWKSEYSVNVPEIDGQHQNLFRLAAQLHEAIVAGRGRGVQQQFLERLVRYTQVHFGFEERLLEQSGFPDYPAHRAEHAALIQQVQLMQEEIRTGRLLITVHMLKLLKDWLAQHIAGSDQQYAPYLKPKPPESGGARAA